MQQTCGTTRPTENNLSQGRKSLYSLPIPKVGSLREHPFVWFVALLCCVPSVLIATQGLESVSVWFAPELSENAWRAPWRMLPPTFVHYTLLHWFTNVYLWWYFGSKVEERSRGELILVFLFSAILGNLAQWLISGPNFGGLSGVTYGLLAYCWCITYFYKTDILQLDKALSVILLILLPLAATGMFGTFSNGAHVAGLCSGAFLATVKYILNKDSQRK